MTEDVIVTIGGQPVVLIAETVRKGRDGRMHVEADPVATAGAQI